MSSLRERLLKPLPVPTERVDLPEFGDGEFVVIHGMTAKEKNAHDSSLMNAKWSGVHKKKAATQKERLVIQCARDAD